MNFALTLIMEGETVHTTWDDFAAENDLADEPEWQAEIEAALKSQGYYHGGGGAQPEYRLELPRPSPDGD